MEKEKKTTVIAAAAAEDNAHLLTEQWNCTSTECSSTKDAQADCSECGGECGGSAIANANAAMAVVEGELN